MPCIEMEVLIGGENGQSVARSDRTDEKVCVGSLYPLCPAPVEEFGGSDVVFGPNRDIGERVQMLPESFELSFLTNTRQDLLTDWANEFGAVFRYKSLEFDGDGRAAAL